MAIPHWMLSTNYLLIFHARDLGKTFYMTASLSNGGSKMMWDSHHLQQLVGKISVSISCSLSRGKMIVIGESFQRGGLVSEEEVQFSSPANGMFSWIPHGFSENEH